jgi:2-haloacid dehalogenase
MTTFVFDAYGTLYDVHSVASATEEAFPGHGDAITQVWRLKQLEYTWLRSLMGRYQDFWTVTRESLAYTLKSLGLEAAPETFDSILKRYLHLRPYPEAMEALEGLRSQGHRLAILSNGSQSMLDALVRNTGFDRALDAVLSVDAKGIFKPTPQSYSLVEEKLGVPAGEVVFVSCNPFDVSGAKSYGFKVAWIERVPAAALQSELRASGVMGPGTMFKVLRMRTDELGFDPDVRIRSLTDLIGLDPNAAATAQPALATPAQAAL